MRLPRAAALVTLASAAALAGCRTTTVATQNLDAVLSSSDQFRYRGTTTTAWRDFWNQGMNTFRAAIGADRSVPDEKSIKNPTKLALKNLRELSESTQGRVEWRQNEQVRTFARFARYAPSQLCRERALLELSSHGQRLAVLDPFFPDEAANAPEIGSALSGLVDAMRRLVDDGAVTETARADFDAAMDILGSTTVDIQGGSRLLRALGPFMKTSALPSEFRDRIDQLSLDVQETMVREAIWAGALDPSEFVRAAAFRIGLEVYGDPFRIEALLALGPRSDLPPGVRERHGTFELAVVPPALGSVHIVVANDIAENGLPLDARRQTVEGLELRGSMVFTLLRIAASELTYTDAARYAAMRALSTVSGGELRTLRAEEWDDWWRDVAPTLEAELERLRRAEGLGLPDSSP